MIAKTDALSIKQERAMELMVCGMTDGEVAKRLRVSRKTINVWRNHDAEFQMEIAKLRQNLLIKNQDAMNALVSKSIAVIGEVLQGENQRLRLSAARAVLRISGLEAMMKGGKPTTREEVLHEFLSEVIGKAAAEMGVGDARRLGSGE